MICLMHTHCNGHLEDLRQFEVEWQLLMYVEGMSVWDAWAVQKRYNAIPTFGLFLLFASFTLWTELDVYLCTCIRIKPHACWRQTARAPRVIMFNHLSTFKSVATSAHVNSDALALGRVLGGRRLASQASLFLIRVVLSERKEIF